MIKMHKKKYSIDKLLNSINFEKGLLDYNLVRRIKDTALNSDIVQKLVGIISQHFAKVTVITNTEGVFEVIENKLLLGYVIHFPRKRTGTTFFFNEEASLLYVQEIEECKLILKPLIVNPVDWLSINIPLDSKTNDLDQEWRGRLEFKNITISYFNELERKIRLYLNDNSNNCKIKAQLVTLLVQNVPTLYRLEEARSLYLTINDKKIKESLLSVYRSILYMLNSENSPRNKIVRINWGIYNRCPLMCIGCYNVFNTSIMSFQECIIIANKLVKYNLKELIISGGDPLLWPYIVEFCEYISRNGILIGIDTVSYNFDEKLCHKLIDKIAYIGIPLDGPNQKIIEYFRRGKEDLFPVTLRSLNIANEAGMPVRINTTVHKKNIDSLDGIAEIILRYPSIKIWSIYQWWPVRGNELINKKLLVDTLEFDYKTDCLKKAFPNLNIVPRKIYERECNTFFISSNGEVYTFGEDETISTIILGDIKTQSLEEILTSPALKANSNKFLPNSRFYNNILLKNMYE